MATVFSVCAELAFKYSSAIELKDINGKTYRATSAHAYAITDIKLVNGEYYVTFTDPWSTSEAEFTVKLDELSKQINVLSYAS